MRVKTWSLVGVLLVACGMAAFVVAADGAGRERLTIVSGEARHVFHVELADTPAKRRRGLMYRKSLPLDVGMLFPFDREEQAHFWMRNTEIALDMLFIARDGRIADLHEMAVPFSERTVSSAMPVWAVLEINGGLSKRLGIRVGDRVEHPFFVYAN